MIIYQVESNQHKTRVKNEWHVYALVTAITVFVVGSSIFAKPSMKDQTTEYLKQFTFGKFAPLAVAVEPQVAGTSAMVVKTHPVTKEEMILATDHPKEIDHIWLKESSRGKNKVQGGLQDICEQEGKSNEFGYGGMAMRICFNSFEESVQVINDWLNKRTDESLCFYNIGIKTPDCTYVK